MNGTATRGPPTHESGFQVGAFSKLLQEQSVKKNLTQISWRVFVVMYKGARGDIVVSHVPPGRSLENPDTESLEKMTISRIYFSYIFGFFG